MIPGTQTQVLYAGNGVSTSFPFNNKIFAPTDLVVTLINQSTGAAVVQPYPSAYTVGNVDVDTGCVVLMNIAPSMGYNLDIRTVTSMLQSTSIKNQTSFLPELHEEFFDRITRELQDTFRRTYTFGIHGPDNENIPWPALPASVDRRGLALLFDASGLPTVGTPAGGGGTTPSQSVLGQTLFPQTPAEIAASVVPTYYYFVPGDIRRYGAVLNGTTDDTAAVQNWAKVGGQLVWPVAQTAKVSAQITFGSNTTVYACKGATVTTATADISLFYATAQSNITITGMGFSQTAAGAAAYIGHIAFVNCTDCRIENCTSLNYQWSGFYIDGGLRCYVLGNYISGLTGSANASSDIVLYRQCNYCIVAYNECFGTGTVGVTVQDPYALPELAPFKNTITQNKVGAHSGYGILLYSPSRAALGGMNTVNPGSITNAGSAYTDGQYNGVAVTALTGAGSGATANVTVLGGVVTAFYVVLPGGNYADLDTVTVAAALIGGTGSGFVFTLATQTVCQGLNTHNEISFNVVQDITGTYLAGGSGMGIYVVGAGNGGTKIIGNTVKNCCISSTGSALALAAITVTGTPGFAGNATVEVLGNVVSEQTQYQGIYITGMQCPVVVSGGGITLPSTNTTGAALRVTNCSNVTVGGGIQILNQGTGQGVLVQSLTVASVKINFGTMQVVSGAGAPFQVTQALGLGLPDFKLIGADLSTTSSTPNGLSLSGLVDGIVVGNKVSVGGQSVLNFADCTGTVVDDNVWKRASGTVIVTFGGTGSNNYFGKGNRGVAANGNVVNGATSGVLIELYGTAIPTLGTWCRGDRVVNSQPAVASPKAWSCTASAAPGTWVSEGNL